jgi:hypothetical protein
MEEGCDNGVTIATVGLSCRIGNRLPPARADQALRRHRRQLSTLQTEHLIFS